MDLLKLFNEAKKKSEENSKQDKKDFKDDRFLEFPKGNYTYKFRLVFAVPENSKRVHPFIYQQSHSFYDEDNREFFNEVCPTSDYLLYNKGFDICPVCKEASKLYKEYDKTNSELKYKLYKKIKRSFNGYGVVYVYNDPVNEENNGKFKLIRFGWTIYKSLQRDVFGIVNNQDEDQSIDDDEVIGFEAFDLKSGYDFMICTEPQGDYNRYSIKWSKKKSKAPFTEDEALQAVKDLRFDEDFYKDYSLENLTKLVNRFVSIYELRCNNETNEEKEEVLVEVENENENNKEKDDNKDVNIDLSSQNVDEEEIDIDDLFKED